MKSYQLVQLQEQGKFYLNQSRGWFQQNWFTMALLLLLIFILVKKDVTMQFSMKAGGETETPAIEEKAIVKPVKSVQEKTAPVVQEMSMLSLPSLMKTATSKADANKKEKEFVFENKANDFANLSFLLNPGYAEKYGVDKSIVDANNTKCKTYIRRFAPVAMAEMRKYGIPASITIAQGLLESDAGDSRLSNNSNNHFGLKCFSKSCAKGHCSNFTDDTHKDFFRNFSSPWESYRAHSLLLQKKRYKHLHQLEKTDYKAWAIGLQKAGYATDQQYAAKLVKIIEMLGLAEYDR